MNKKITVAGTGYVGLSMSVLLSQYNDVFAIDVVKEKVNMINSKQSPINDRDIKDYLKEKNLHLTATTDPSEAYTNAQYVIIAVPTNYDEIRGYFDTHCVEDVIELCRKYNKECTFIIKSTIPIGYTKSLEEKYEGIKIMFSPEFLREGQALYDNLHPSRIIVGINNEELKSDAITFMSLLEEASQEDSLKINKIITKTTEAEAIKLFANSYLAMRVAFFNELDTYAEVNGLNASDILRGVCYDPRIGNSYNNPSFGYGGYCFPKDTKQMLANFKDIPQDIIGAIVNSNDTRKEYIIDTISKKIRENNIKKIGIYKLAMKANSDNFRKSAIIDIMNGLRDEFGYSIDIIIYDESIENFEDFEVRHDFEAFKNECDLIIANRLDYKLKEIKNKVYTRDVFGGN